MSPGIEQLDQKTPDESALRIVVFCIWVKKATSLALGGELLEALRKN